LAEGLVSHHLAEKAIHTKSAPQKRIDRRRID
jgi:hypothetical protein